MTAHTAISLKHEFPYKLLKSTVEVAPTRGSVVPCFSSEQFDGTTPRDLLSTRSFDALLSYITVGCGCGVGRVSIGVSWGHHAGKI